MTLLEREAPAVSFVVIAFNEEAHVEATVNSILEQEELDDFEVVVVDDASSDATATIVKSLAARHLEVRLVEHETNQGRGAARASGVSAARGEIIAMVDSDILLPTHWWRTCRDELADYDVVGGTAVPDGDVAYVHQRSGLAAKVARATTVVTGNNGVYRAEVLRRVSFDPRLTEGEDIAINHALKSAGYRLKCIEGLLVEHQEDKDFRRSVGWLYLSGKGATRQFLTYREVRTPDVAFAGFLGALVVVLGSRRRARAFAVMLGYLVAVAFGHLRGRFVLDPRRPLPLLRGLAVDTVLIGAYFVGRAAGVRIVTDPVWRASLRSGVEGRTR